jgi:predicted permease
MSPERALSQAIRRFGNVTSVKERFYESRRILWLDHFIQDSRYALRALRKTPGFTAVAVLTLALGIGANTVVFGIIDALLLRPLPVESPEQIVTLNRNDEPSQSFPNYRDIRDRNAVLSSLFLYRIAPLSLGQSAGANRVWGYLVTANYFEGLGVKPALGRFFRPDEDLHPNADAVAVLGYDCWQDRFGGDPNIIGQTIRLNTHPYIVIGVAPKRFQGTEIFYWPEIWAPISMQSQLEGFAWLERRNTFNGFVSGRLKPGVTAAQANENLKAIADVLAQEHSTNEGMRITVARPGLFGGTLRRPATAFAAGVMLLASLVLLASCANIAGLLSARLTDRHRELAVRVSIGASRGRIVRQLMTESIVASLLGGIAGVAVAVALLRLLSYWRAPLAFPIHFEVTPDRSVFIFAFVTALLTGLLFGVLPAFRGWRTDPNQGLKGFVSSGPQRRWAVRDFLLLAQVAICCLLITASFLAIQGLARSLRMPVGFQTDGAIVAGYDLGMAGYTEQRGRIFHQQALEAVSRIPGVRETALGSSVPLSIDQSKTDVFPEQTVDFRPSNSTEAIYYYVSPGYFRTMRTNLIAGREFTWRDTAEAPAVAVVNETLGRKVLGAGQPADWIGRRIRTGGALVEIVGIAEDGKYMMLTEAPTPAIFMPILRRYSGTAVVIARSSGPEGEAAENIRLALTDLDAGLPVYDAGSLAKMLQLVFLPANAAVVALGSFGLLAMMLATSGIYGLAAYTVAQRRREIGVRIAVGARPGHVLRLVLGRTALLLALGSLAGIFFAMAGSQILSNIVVVVSPRDPLVLSGAILATALIGIAAACPPLLRALRIDPAQTLKSEQ